MEIKFGFWPRKCTLQIGDVIIKELPDYETVVQQVLQSGRVSGKWLYPPLAQAHGSSANPKDLPLVHESAYGIAPTHRIELPTEQDAEDLAYFLIALAGLLDGLRLIPKGWSHFYRCAVELHTLSDLVCDTREIEAVLRTSTKFWTADDDESRRLIFGAVHWCMFAESYIHEFERFGAQYIVLDTCFRLHCHRAANPISVRHGARPSFLAEEYGMRIPSWAIVRPHGGCALSDLRNEFFHEGRYGGKSIGFGHPQFSPSIDLQLLAFNTRLIIAMLGIICGYVRSPVDTRAMHGLDLDGR